MSRAALHSHQSQLLGHQSSIPPGMKQPPVADDQKPSRLMQMREDYQRRLLKEKEEKLVHMYEDQHRKNLERAERVVRGPQGGAGGATGGAYPNSRLPQPGGLYNQQNGGGYGQQGAANGSPSVRDFFRERRELESKGGYVPPIKHHYNQSRGRAGSGNSHHKNSAGVDRAKPLAPIQARHSGVSSAPTSQPGAFSNKPRLPRKNPAPASCPDTPDNNDNYFNGKPNNSARSAAPKKSSPPASRAPPSQPRGVKRDPAPRPQEEKMSDFQKWQMDQNKAREERLKKLNMRAPPSGRESGSLGGGYEYEEEEGDEEEEAPQSVRGGQEDAVARQQRELMEKIAQQQAELSRMRIEREEEEERERLEAEMLKKQETAERERRRRQQQEEARRRREEEAQARREEQEEQRRAAAARAKQQQEQQQQQQRQQERQHRYYDEDDDGDYPDSSAPNTHRSAGGVGRPYGGNQSQNNSQQQPTPRDRQSPAEFSRNPHPPPARRQQPQPPRARHSAGRPGHDRQNTEQDDETPVPGPGVDFYARAALEGEQGPKVKLVSCRNCDRKFAVDRIDKHQVACKNAQKKRNVFDPTKMRTEGTDMAKYISKNSHKKEPVTKKKADWRRQHEEFITNIRYAKQMQQMEQQGVPLKDLPPPPPSHNPDLVPCPNCGRTFNETAAERHIPRCKDLKTRPAANRRR